MNDIKNGALDTHVTVPVDYPFAYAMTFELADEIAKLCPSLFSSDYKSKRELLWNRFVVMNIFNNRTERLSKDTKFLEAAEAVYIIPMLAGGGRATIARRAIRNLNPSSIAENMVRNDACNSNAMRRFADNLAALGTFSRMKALKHPNKTN